MKKVLLTGLSLAMVAALAIGGTVAYLTTGEQTKENVFTVGNVSIDLEEKVDETTGSAQVVETEDGASYTGIMPGDYLQKEVTVTNTGRNAAYVRVDVTLNNIQAINNAIDDFYEDKGYSDEQVQAVYNYVFDGWGINYNPRPGAADIDDARGVIDGTYGLPNHVINVDFTKKISDYWLYGANNMFKGAAEADGKYWIDSYNSYEDGYYVADMEEETILYTYYIELESGESTTLFKGLRVPAEFNAEQLAMFDGLNIDVVASAIQADNFATAEEAFEALRADAEDGYEGSIAETAVSSDEELKAALTADEKTIVVHLTSDVTYDAAAWSANGMGGASTEEIIIYGNGNTLTFNQTNSDWNNVVTNNGATLSINNANITNAGHNNGPWNRHDINFACDVVLNDVVSDKALAFKAGAALTNVTIDDANTSDTYAIWIQPNGQTVTLDGCTIDMYDCADGRGIKIDEQYVDAPAKVTLNVANTTFKTEEKSAILVKSAAGADITLSNVDITGVVADSTNAVWVDEASAVYADLVTVSGGTKIVEGSAETPVVRTAASTEEIKEAVKSGADSIVVKGGTISVNAGIGVSSADLYFEGTTINTTSTTYTGFQHAGNVTYNNVTFNGGMNLYGDKVVFNNCTVNLTTNYIWTYGAAEVEFNNCIFNTDGKAILVYTEGSEVDQVVTVKDCTFNATNTAVSGSGLEIAAVSVDGSLPSGGDGTFTVNFEGTNTVDSDFNGLWQIKAGADNVTINE